ncbi:BREX-3 system P-loop-containing protein BrxF [Intestinibaculum porci]|uniref:BREX-3 system P-loop-containing protein BrxF n=1 Tax=Intestinibaculum porci TaxID=2487118 RepID=UPI0024093018|nr:BREX-3 system P-loop-containing protein BrxF [Intestinibaculum porci]MDD6348988.1 BREX-3 system P-loop-containing protein BrxF [Intestinibaculum porci]
MDSLVEAIEGSYNGHPKLVLVVGKPGSGKSKLVKEYSHNTGIPIVDFSKVLTDDQHDLKTTMKEFLKNYRFDVLLIDNKAALYDALNDDLKDVLDDLAKKVTVVATWNGYINEGNLAHIVNGDEVLYPLDGSFEYVLVQ